mmetsp:Transcript_3995/g.8140  ORF Transcript_3995/g.8140 Transcript_3995/m.8140 type:complete len:215 (-) Transcript_3995:971-1615(-)
MGVVIVMVARRWRILAPHGWIRGWISVGWWVSIGHGGWIPSVWGISRRISGIGHVRRHSVGPWVVSPRWGWISGGWCGTTSFLGRSGVVSVGWHRGWRRIAVRVWRSTVQVGMHAWIRMAFVFVLPRPFLLLLLLFVFVLPMLLVLFVLMLLLMLMLMFSLMLVASASFVFVFFGRLGWCRHPYFLAGFLMGLFFVFGVCVGCCRRWFLLGGGC